MLRRPGGVGGAPPAAEAKEGALGGQAGWAANIQGDVAASTGGGEVAAEGHPGTASAAVPHSEPTAQFQSSPAAPTCDHP